MLNKLRVKQVVIVEGRYDKIKLESLIDGVIIPVNGFGVYKDKSLLALIRKFAEERGVVILTDSDNAGRQIRNYLRNCFKGCEVYDVYVPALKGKEKRKLKSGAGAEGIIGVEGIGADIIRKAFEKAGLGTSVKNAGSADLIAPATVPESAETGEKITRERLYDDGFIGGINSAGKRKALQRALELPENLSAKALLDVLNLYGSDEYERVLNIINNE